MKIEELGNDMVRLTADEGKYLFDRRTGHTYSEATVKTNKVHFFSEVDQPVAEQEEVAEEAPKATTATKKKKSTK